MELMSKYTILEDLVNLLQIRLHPSRIRSSKIKMVNPFIRQSDSPYFYVTDKNKNEVYFISHSPCHLTIVDTPRKMEEMLSNMKEGYWKPLAGVFYDWKLWFR